MNKREAKRRVAEGALKILEAASDQEWLYEGYSDADADRMFAAFEELMERLASEADKVRRTKNRWNK